LTSIVPVPGEVKTEGVRHRPAMRGGKTMPVRLYHKLAFGADGAPGASRTLVISRARDERLRSAARRRSPLHALLRSHPDGDRDRRPRPARWCAPMRRFAKLAQSLSPTAPAGKSIFRRSTSATATC
jgi:two-component system cell cycle sensor histidine kinase/response regulator CckA